MTSDFLGSISDLFLLNSSLLLRKFRYIFSVTVRDIAVWAISALIAIGVGCSRYAKWKTRDRLVRELAVMDPVRREKMLNRLDPKTAMEARQQLLERFRIMS